MESAECPTCHSTDIASASAIYEQGVAVTTSQISGAAFSADGSLLMGAGSTGVSRSLLAQRLAPPRRSSTPVQLGVLVCLGCCVVGFAALPFAFLIGLGLGVFTAHQLSKKALPEYQARRAAWEATWVCLRCGAQFSRDLPAAAKTANPYEHLPSYYDPNRPKAPAPVAAAAPTPRLEGPEQAH